MLIFSLKLIWLFDSKYIIIFAWLMDLITFIVILLDKNISKAISGIHFLEKVLSVSFKVLFLHLQFYKITIIIHFEIKEINLYYIPALQIIVTIGILFHQVIQQERNKRKNLIIAYSYSILYILQLLLLSLKWNKYFVYSYYQTFIITWTALGINTFLMVLLLIAFVEKCFQKDIPEIDGIMFKYQGSIILWLLYYIFGLTIIPFFLLKEICQFYERDTIQINIRIAGITVLISIILYLISFSYYTNKIRKQLMYLKFHYQNRIVLKLENRQTQVPIPQSPQIEPPKKKWSKLKIPVMFIRISASYYKLVSKKKINEMNNRNISSIPICSDVLRPDSLNFRQSPCLTMMKQMKSIPRDQDSCDICLICFENEPDIILSPCNHGGICTSCSENLKKTTKQCFLCRTDIKYTLKLNQKIGEILEVTDVQKV
ncbi:unnamed protein product (macronuclear) [Paramecium tetraurelia]|uniref:RING-type domain-containing protein n=1 Tax=Paramecium tetraurelia TaxID=5888 RepID=A0E7T4_PARTE|nr:uncharacterized protein GSPATT00024079001 [Paramecium tetraurelia]CAK91351.1 unnamed protein product [Paramecium tetraurelia]|eukprot:XP_001458748.1 hypothetical protein (macronuclear) [Paramecium tetraurelia strain d4-2]